jgi:uridine kinase
MVKIFCVNTQTSEHFQEGLTLMEMLSSFEFERPYPILCAKVNNVSQGLKYRAFNSREVEFLDYTSYIGRSVYCSSLCFLLTKAAKDLFPESKITIRRPISKGYF